MDFAHGFEQQILQSRVKIPLHEQPVAHSKQVNVRIGNVSGQADETSPQHDMLQPGDPLEMASACVTFISRIQAPERALQEAVIDLRWNHRYIDLAGDQCID